MKLSYSAPAKVILSGEHAVVYGKPALVAAIDLRLTCIVETSKENKLDKQFQILYDTVEKYLTTHSIDHKKIPVYFEIQSNIPRGRGLGSSAALSVASVAALYHLLTGKEASKEIINNLAYKIEKYFHTNPSGVDNSTSTMGGLIFYRKEFEFLKYISSLQLKIPKNIEDKLYLIDTGKPSENTAEMVEKVGKKYNEQPHGMDQLFQKVEKTTKRMVVSLMKEDVAFFKACVEENEKLLEEIGVVSEKAKHILSSLKKFGSGKITGAGGLKTGSGYLLFVSTDSPALESYLTAHKLPFITFKQSSEGVISL